MIYFLTEAGRYYIISFKRSLDLEVQQTSLTYKQIDEIARNLIVSYRAGEIDQATYEAKMWALYAGLAKWYVQNKLKKLENFRHYDDMISVCKKVLFDILKNDYFDLSEKAKFSTYYYHGLNSYVMREFLASERGLKTSSSQVLVSFYAFKNKVDPFNQREIDELVKEYTALPNVSASYERVMSIVGSKTYSASQLVRNSDNMDPAVFLEIVGGISENFEDNFIEQSLDVKKVILNWSKTLYPRARTVGEKAQSVQQFYIALNNYFEKNAFNEQNIKNFIFGYCGIKGSADMSVNYPIDVKRWMDIVVQHMKHYNQTLEGLQDKQTRQHFFNTICNNLQKLQQTYLADLCLIAASYVQMSKMLDLFGCDNNLKIHKVLGLSKQLVANNSVKFRKKLKEVYKIQTTDDLKNHLLQTKGV